MLVLILPAPFAAQGPAVSLRAAYTLPKVSTASFLVQPRAVRGYAALSWEAPLIDGLVGYVVEGRVRGEATHRAADEGWGRWEVASSAPVEASEFTHPLEPGYEYEFRVAPLSEAEGQGDFSDPSRAVSLLRQPGQQQVDASDGCYL